MASTHAIKTDVVVVGAGPGGSAAAYYLAKAGVEVYLLEKATFPRDKICGDGLTPAAVNELALMGIDTSNWQRNLGLEVVGGGHEIRLPWPAQRSLPDFGMACPRMELDETLARAAAKAGANLVEGVLVKELKTDATGRVNGVVGFKGRGEDEERYDISAKLVVDAGGVAARLAISAGRQAAARRPMAVAARTYFRSPLGDTDWMISHLELWDGKPGESNLLPGYGWIFPLGDGLVNVGLGSVSSNKAATKLPYKQIFGAWCANLPEEWGFTEENQTAPLRSAALPMCFNRKPQYADGLALIGDAAGMVSPFNGEGIAPAMQAGRFLAEAFVLACARDTQSGFDLAMSAYPQALRNQLGGYYSLGRIFVKLIERPQIMRACTKYGLPRPALMKLVHKLLSDGYERSGGDLSDKLIQTLTKVVPSA
ncbi:drug:proton antiporter [Boudabousia tangfeifanii]|uniref:Drug:proton antiporter n=1 Tax=Boudabousia tangfeifanii TaxID=1912795 RepID=A0A1D9MJ15_9ACTO|nr:geranylgeranyl reductase family protein [Boudabousia tangfeifanii]AOZ72183.1 drug:proton antiporter [Boudabousia tangfeifanii]